MSVAGGEDNHDSDCHGRLDFRFQSDQAVWQRGQMLVAGPPTREGIGRAQVVSEADGNDMRAVLYGLLKPFQEGGSTARVVIIVELHANERRSWSHGKDVG